MKARDNPFATHRLDALDYRPQGETWEEMLSRLQTMGWRGAVVGPEGSGKTALLDDLARRLRCKGWQILGVQVAAGQRALAADGLETLRAAAVSQVAILADGTEQLSPSGWRDVMRASADAGALVAATHPGASRSPALPPWVQCRTSQELLLHLAMELLGSRAQGLQWECNRAFAARGGNVRLALLDLYDVWAVSG